MIVGICCCVAVIYIFDAQTGKAMGDGKPITHKVSASHFVISSFFLCSFLSLFSPISLGGGGRGVG